MSAVPGRPEDLRDIYDDVPEGALVVARIEVVRYLTADHDLLIYQATDRAGYDLPLVEALGMLRMTEDTVIRTAMGEVPDDDEDDDGDGDAG